MIMVSPFVATNEHLVAGVSDRGMHSGCYLHTQDSFFAPATQVHGWNSGHRVVARLVAGLVSEFPAFRQLATKRWVPSTIRESMQVLLGMPLKSLAMVGFVRLLHRSSLCAGGFQFRVIF